MKTAFIDRIISAMELHEIKAYYQPQYDADTGRMVSAEALVRWEKPDGEIITPDQFIPRLERTENINFLDWFMAEEACRTIRELGDHAIPIAVNFSRWHVKEQDFYRKLQSLLASYGIKPELFEVEITESALSVEDFDRIEQWARNVAEIGVKIAIDDFGAGFTSLQFVKDMPVNYLKVDKAFLEDNCQDDRGRGTLETVFYFAHRLKLRTIAEGVETMEQLKFLQNLDCDRVQGYLFSRPIKKDDFILLATMDSSIMMEDDEDYLLNQGCFSTQSMLLEAVKEEYQLVIFGNLFKNSYHVMYQSNNLNFNAPTAGVIDDMSEFAMQYCSPGYDKIYQERLSRESLIAAYTRGERRVEAVIKQMFGTQESTYRTVIHLMAHPNKNDILMIGFSREIIKAEA
ncbi:MAG: EAL domain-containing protein [Pseudobutyrivibrio sp.]|nr:EAL domain-containing protein [Pseudobutyrivibrio sp.]